MRLKLISCEVFFRELCDACAHAPHPVDVEFLPKGLHDVGGRPMAAKIQEAVDCTPRGVYDAILLGFGLCGNALDGLTARHTRLVAPRAHDCIALLLGSRQRYEAFFKANPGTYYRSTGWLERGKDVPQLNHDALGVDQSLADLTRRYGEDNGRYLYDALTRHCASYNQLVFIETGLEPDANLLAEAAAEAAEKGWRFERLPADLGWLRRMVDGVWAESEFVIVMPGQRMVASYDTAVFEVKT